MNKKAIYNSDGMSSKIKKLKEKKYNKLVRDKIPERIKKNGEIPTIKILDDEQFKYELERKLQEEYQEVLNAPDSKKRLEELADMLEVI